MALARIWARRSRLGFGIVVSMLKLLIQLPISMITSIDRPGHGTESLHRAIYASPD